MLLPLVMLMWRSAITIRLAVLPHAPDRARRTVVAFYEVDSVPTARFRALAGSFTAVQHYGAHCMSPLRMVYFLPDRILIRGGRRYAGMRYSNCRITGTAARFVEEGHVPRDAERVGTTWKYVNEGGGPDRRYKNNPQLPAIRYGELTPIAQRGFHFVRQIIKSRSRTGAVGHAYRHPRDRLATAASLGNANASS